MSYAEFETDKIIFDSYFKNVIGTMVEVGAGPPVFYSMSKIFRDCGWRCVCIDPNPKFVQQHKECGNEIYQFACSNENKKESNFCIVDTTGYYSWEEKNNGISISAIEIKYPMPNLPIQNITIEIKKLDTILEELNIDKVDFVSIDTEGWELEVMDGFNVNKYQPKIILLENVKYLQSYVDYMNIVGYELDKKIDYNYIFIKK